MGRSKHVTKCHIFTKRTQMTRNRTSLRGNQLGSGESEDDSSDAKSPKEEKTPSRGREASPRTRKADITGMMEA